MYIRYNPKAVATAFGLWILSRVLRPTLSSDNEWCITCPIGSPEFQDIIVQRNSGIKCTFLNSNDSLISISDSSGRISQIPSSSVLGVKIFG